MDVFQNILFFHILECSMTKDKVASNNMQCEMHNDSFKKKA